MLLTDRRVQSAWPRRWRALVGVLAVLAWALLALSCHLVVPYAASELDAAGAGSGRDGGWPIEDGDLEAADGWVLREGGVDGSASGSGCSRGVAEHRVDDTMVVCRSIGRDRWVDACHAASLCNAGRGWRPCSPLLYRERFKTQRPPVKDAWLGGCLFDVSASPEVREFREACPYCVRADRRVAFPVAAACLSTGEEDDRRERDVDWIHTTKAMSVGLVSAERCAIVLLGSAGLKSALWLPAPASDERAAAFCCLQPK